MKKFKWTLLLSLLFLIIFARPLPVYAADDGYYIKNMNVDVQVNDARQYIITEKIDAHFNEARHGIIRKISTHGSAEDCTVSNISVKGSPYTVEQGSTVQIKIGSEDEKLKGDKSYTIRYTLNHYDDEEDDGDYLYLNVLGTQWDTRIEKFTANITYPSHMTLNNYNITSGGYSDKGNSLNVKHSVNENKINIESNSEIDEHNGITINAKFNNGDYTYVPKYKYDYIINNEETNIDITKQQEYIVNQTYDIKALNASDDLILSLLSDYEEGSKLYDFKCSNDEIELSSDGKHLYVPRGIGTYIFTVSYKVKPPIFSDLSFKLFRTGNSTRIENMRAVVKSEVQLDNYKVSDDKKNNVAAGNNTITITNNKLKRNQTLTLELGTDKKLFSRPMPKTAYAALIMAVVSFMIAVILYFLFGRDEKIYHIVEFYPPDGISSAEAAYIMKGHCSNTDITSLIFYWASHNHLKIVMNRSSKKKKYDDGFTLRKSSSLDSSHKKFEVDLFNSIFSKGRGGSVSSESLKEKVYTDINKAVNSVRKVFTEERSLYSKKSAFMRKISFFLCLLPLIPLVMSRIAEAGCDGGDIFFRSVFSVSALVLFYGITCKFNSFYRMGQGGKTAWIIFSAVMYFIIVSAFIGFYIYDIIPFGIVFFTVIFLFAGLFVTAFVSKKSRYNVDMISRLLGFKEFMVTAEKERLEALIEDNPEYFYNTLPYAQVLGVTHVWKDKFKEITMAPPSWYDGGFDTFDYMMINSMVDNMNTVSSDMTSVPSSSDSSGGFDGGGFSGGGSGGGGGSSW